MIRPVRREHDPVDRSTAANQQPDPAARLLSGDHRGRCRERNNQHQRQPPPGSNEAHPPVPFSPDRNAMPATVDARRRGAGNVRAIMVNRAGRQTSDSFVRFRWRAGHNPTGQCRLVRPAGCGGPVARRGPVAERVAGARSTRVSGSAGCSGRGRCSRPVFQAKINRISHSARTGSTRPCRPACTIRSSAGRRPLRRRSAHPGSAQPHG